MVRVRGRGTGGLSEARRLALSKSPHSRVDKFVRAHTSPSHRTRSTKTSAFCPMKIQILPCANHSNATPRPSALREKHLSVGTAKCCADSDSHTGRGFASNHVQLSA